MNYSNATHLMNLSGPRIRKKSLSNVHELARHERCKKSGQNAYNNASSQVSKSRI